MVSCLIVLDRLGECDNFTLAANCCGISMNHMWYVAQRLPTPSQSSGGRAPGNAGRQAEQQVKAKMQIVTTERTKQVKADRKKDPPESSKTRHLRTVGQDLASNAAPPLSGCPWC